MSSAQDTVLAYHEATKHRFHAFARGPGYLDWANQPDPFRRYAGSEIIALDRPTADDDGPAYEDAFYENRVAPAALSRGTVSRLFFDSLALSAWKQAGGSRWALRVNPSSGNLHPTEGYLVCGPVPGLSTTPMVCHYAPAIHALEVRTRFSEPVWRTLTAQLPQPVLLVALSAIAWREAWKYGERAFRYCQLDTGHALGAVTLAAAALGWKARLLDELGDEQLRALLGLPRDSDPEAERPECLLAVFPQGNVCAAGSLPQAAIAAIAAGAWQGFANRLSPSHRRWPVLEEAQRAARKPPTDHPYALWTPPAVAPLPGGVRAPLRRFIRRRRSAVDMDGRTRLDAPVFCRILSQCLPHAGRFPFNALPWPPAVHLALFVHRVEGMTPGLYALVRRPDAVQALRQALDPGFDWEPPGGSSPRGLPLYRLAAGDVRALAARLACHQEIAGDAVAAVAMLAEFESRLAAHGAWFYRRLHWECGVLGQVLYLEAEAAGIRGTGIGCFFDDPTHAALGLAGRSYQDLYHFTLGGPVEDPRLTTLPPYPADGGNR